MVSRRISRIVENAFDQKQGSLFGPIVLCKLTDHPTDLGILIGVNPGPTPKSLHKERLFFPEFTSLPELEKNPLVKRVIDTFDTDGNGEVDFKEFIEGRRLDCP